MVEPKVTEKKHTATSGSPTPSSSDVESGKQLPLPAEVASPRDVHGFKWFLTVCAMLSTVFLFSLDNTVVADVQPAIISSFGQIQDLPWLGAAFALGAVAILPWSKAYGVYNIKWIFIANIIIFEAGSALCGGAPNMIGMIVGRVIAGVGGSGMYMGSLMLLTITTSEQERPVYMGILGMVWGIGTVLGPIVGGAFADSSATWRWAFYINLVIGAMFAPVFFLYLPNIDFQKGISALNRTKQLDPLGNPVFFVMLVCLIMAINFGGSYFPWSSGREIALIVMTGVLFLAFIIIEHFHPFIPYKNRLYPLHFHTRPLLFNVQVQLFLLSGVMLGAAYYIPLYFQFARGDSALEAGVRLLPYIAMTVTFSLLNGNFMGRFGYYMPWYVFTGITITIGSALMTTVDINTSTSKVYGYSALIGMGVGASVQAGFPVSQALIKGPEEITDVVGFMGAAQSAGITTILAIAGCIFNNVSFTRISSVLPSMAASDIRMLTAGRTSDIYNTLQPKQRDAAVNEIVETISSIWYLFLACGAVSLILSAFLRRDKLFQKKDGPGMAM